MELHVGRPKQDPYPLRGVDSQRFADQAASARDLVKLVRALGSAGRSGAATDGAGMNAEPEEHGVGFRGASQDGKGPEEWGISLQQLEEIGEQVDKTE